MTRRRNPAHDDNPMLTSLGQQAPLLHLNGSSYESLSGGLIEAGKAVTRALDALSAYPLNQRDYYPLGDDAWRRAKAEQDSRYARLKSVYDELLALLDHLDEQSYLRRR